MALALAAAAAFAFYFAAIPLKLALVVHITGRPGFGFGLFPFENRFALRRATQRALGERKHWPWKKADLDLKSMLPSAWRAGKYLLRRMHLEKLHAHGRLSTGDAAHTAMICCCANLLEGALAPFAAVNAVQIRLQPDFSSNESNIRLCGMISIRMGHIICAALIGAWNYILRRIEHGKASN